MPSTTKTTTTKKAKNVKKTPTKNIPKKCTDIPMKNFLILWICLAAMIFLVLAIFIYLIPKAKALDAAQSQNITSVETITSESE